MKHFSLPAIFLLLFCCFTNAQSFKKYKYTLSEENFANPERGFYVPLQTKSSNFQQLTLDQLNNITASPYKLQNATYQSPVSLLYRAWELDEFRYSAISEEFLQKVQTDFDVIKQAGMKVIVRFAYINRVNKEGCNDPDRICPPYGDAPKEYMIKHLEQLTPLLHKNAGVIALVQMGFIGIWGENYYSDYFTTVNKNGEISYTDKNWTDRNEVLNAMLKAVPLNRFVQVRTPQYKQRFLYGIESPLTSPPMNEELAFGSANEARIGFFNDCFLAGFDDYGTYVDHGNSSAKRDTANTLLRKYFKTESKYVPVGGETCDDAFSPQNDCEPHGHAVQEMADYHYSYLNLAYNNRVNNDWDSLGCMNEIQKRMGYRLAVRSSAIPKKIKRGKELPLKFEILNSGFASPFNSRSAYLVLESRSSKKQYPVLLTTDVQKWFPGTNIITGNFQLPEGIEPGNFDLYFHLPDSDAELAARPQYAIRLANKDVWQPSTGLNRLKGTLKVK